MSKVKFVKPEHVEILRDYLDDCGIILVYPEQQNLASSKGIEDDITVTYDYGSEPDLYVERVASDDHHFFSKTAEDLEI